jgi:hypothetical protein
LPCTDARSSLKQEIVDVSTERLAREHRAHVIDPLTRCLTDNVRQITYVVDVVVCPSDHAVRPGTAKHDVLPGPTVDHRDRKI